MTKTVREAVEKVVNYNWPDELKHYREWLSENEGLEIDDDDELIELARTRNDDHIFCSLVILEEALRA